MQINDVGTSGGLVQPVDVLRHQQTDTALPFQGSESTMRIIRLCPPKAPPAHQAARPIPLSGRVLIHESPVLHRLRALPPAVGIPVIWNPRVGTATRAGENKEPRIARNEIL